MVEKAELDALNRRLNKDKTDTISGRYILRDTGLLAAQHAFKGPADVPVGSAACT